ncbi:MAG: hypothetical protein ACXABY_22090, partial [Candidatus Thorarchaeota archaeon]
MAGLQPSKWTKTKRIWKMIEPLKKAGTEHHGLYSLGYTVWGTYSDEGNPWTSSVIEAPGGGTSIRT